MKNEQGYSIGELAALAGVSARTLRHYEDEGVLVPARLPNGYRVYGAADAKRLAQIVSMRACGLPLADIKRLMSDEADLADVLRLHLQGLCAQERELQEAMSRTKAAIARIERIETMEAEKAFEELKAQGVREFEETYGAEARERYGADVIDAANDRMRALSRAQWDEKEELERAVFDRLAAALAVGDPSCSEAAELVRMHRRWVGIHWGIEPEAQTYCALVRGYLADERFVRYYDAPCGEGATEFLVKAVEAALASDEA